MNYTKLLILILSFNVFAGEQLSLIQEAKHDVFLYGISPDNVVFGTSTEIIPFHKLAEADPTETFVWYPEQEVKKIVDFLPGYTLMTPRGMNKKGWLVGEATAFKLPKAGFIWTAEEGTKKLPLIAGSTSSSINAISENGAAGWTSTKTNRMEAAVWTKTATGWTVELLPQETNSSEVKGLSDNGKFAVGKDGGRPVLWEKQKDGWQRSALSTGYGVAKFVNNQGLVAGNTNGIKKIKGMLTTVKTAFVCEYGEQLVEIGTLEGFNSSEPSGINNNGVVIGHATTSRDLKSFSWTKTSGMQAFEGIDEGLFTVTGINDSNVLSVTHESTESKINGLIWRDKF